MNHWRELLRNGYKSHLGNFEIKFPHRSGDRSIEQFSVGITDGLTKLLIMLSIPLFCSELDLGEKELTIPAVRKMLGSFAYVRCSYEHFELPSHYYLHSLRPLLVPF